MNKGRALLLTGRALCPNAFMGNAIGPTAVEAAIDMEKLYLREESRVNTSGASETKKPQDFPDAPARPDVPRPGSYFVKSPIEALAAKIKDPNDPLKKCHLPVLQIMMSHAHNLKSGERGLSFHSQQDIADELGEHRNTVGRAQAAMVKSGLMIKYKARMAAGRKEGGQWAQPYYDMAPVFLMCGENVVPRSLKQVQQYLDDAGYWRRGMKLVRDVPGAPDGAPKPEGPEAQDSDLDRAPNLHMGSEANSHQEGGSTVHQKCGTNNNSSSDYVKKDKVQRGPKRLSGVESLPPGQQAVYCRLKQIGYWHIKAISDLKKHGAAYVEARLDFVLQDAKGVNDKAKMVSHWMERPLSEAYAKAQPKAAQPKAAQPKAAKTEQEHPQGSEERPRPAPPAPPAPAPRPAAAPPEPTKPMTLAEQRGSLLTTLEVYDAKTIALGRAHAKGDRDCSESLRAKLDLPLEEMSLMALRALLDHCQTVDSKLRTARAEAD